MPSFLRTGLVVGKAMVFIWGSDPVAIAAKSPGSNREKNADRVESFAKYVEIPGATRVGSDACTSCHTHRDLAADFPHAFHAQHAVECEDCHGPGSLHIDGGGDVTKIISFRTRTAEEANG